jgi:glycosyltransferase involved in cell wall biosynthesis
MRIGLMLRAYDEQGGVGVYTRNIVRELLAFDRDNEYILLFRNPDHLSLYQEYPNVRTRLVQGNHPAWWDQVIIPLACVQEQLDVLFHPKFTAPLLAPCPVVMTVHGADWFIPEQAYYYTAADVCYIRTFMPLYFKKCARVISVSKLTTSNFERVLRLPPGKIQTVYFAPARHFQRVTDETELARVRARYKLPERFILTLTKRKGEGRKNLGQIFAAYQLYHQAAGTPHSLVVGGKDCYLFREEFSLPADSYGMDIHFPGWIDQVDLPAVYSLADLYLYPSNLEAFPIPVSEAMACGTPLVTSNVNGLVEIAGDAALLVDPQDAQSIANAIQRVLNDSSVRNSLSLRGLERSKLFSWDITTRQTLEILTSVARRN